MHAVFEKYFVHVDSFVKVTRRLVSVCEVVAYGEGVWMVFTQDTDAILKELLVHFGGFVDVARCTVSTRKIITCGKGYVMGET